MSGGVAVVELLTMMVVVVMSTEPCGGVLSLEEIASACILPCHLPIFNVALPTHTGVSIVMLLGQRFLVLLGLDFTNILMISWKFILISKMTQ